MTDDDLEQRLRFHYRRIDPGLPSPALGTRVIDALDGRRSAPTLRVWPIPGLAAMMAAAVVVLLGLAFGLRPGGFLAGLRTSSTAPASLTPGSAFPSAGISTSPAPTPLPPGPDVQAAGLVDPLHGWAVVEHRLQITADGGSTWRDATPPGAFATASADLLLGVDFVDAQHGWVAINAGIASASDASFGRVDLWRTTDGGSTWTQGLLPLAAMNHNGDTLPQVQLDFLDASHGFAFLSGNLAQGANDSDLFWTADGGRTWSADRPTGSGHVGIEGDIGFATGNDGVIVNAPHGEGIVVTHDAGRTWADASLALPPGLAGADRFFGKPAFFNERSGLVAVDFQGQTGSVTRVYRTADAGSSWTLAATLPVRGNSTLAFFDQNRWIGLNGSELLRTNDSGRTWVRTAAVALPGGQPSLLLADEQHAWALVAMDVCLTFKSNCSSRTGLYATVDGGSTWTQLSPR